MKKQHIVSGALVSAALMAVVGLAACGGVASSEQTPSMLSNSGVERPESSIVADERGTISYLPAAAEAATPTMNKHADRGVSCEDCHGEATPKTAPLSDESCLGCHTMGQLIEATASYEDIPNRQVNPHDSHMHGASCTSCHKNHDESVLACNDCHTNEYDYIVP